MCHSIVCDVILGDSCWCQSRYTTLSLLNVCVVQVNMRVRHPLNSLRDGMHVLVKVAVAVVSKLS